jgi:hypothetical protein
MIFFNGVLVKPAKLVATECISRHFGKFYFPFLEKLGQAAEQLVQELYYKPECRPVTGMVSLFYFLYAQDIKRDIRGRDFS